MCTNHHRQLSHIHTKLFMMILRTRNTSISLQNEYVKNSVSFVPIVVNFHAKTRNYDVNSQKKKKKMGKIFSKTFRYHPSKATHKRSPSRITYNFRLEPRWWKEKKSFFLSGEKLCVNNCMGGVCVQQH